MRVGRTHSPAGMVCSPRELSFGDMVGMFAVGASRTLAMGQVGVAMSARSSQGDRDCDYLQIAGATSGSGASIELSDLIRVGC